MLMSLGRPQILGQPRSTQDAVEEIHIKRRQQHVNGVCSQRAFHGRHNQVRRLAPTVDTIPIFDTRNKRPPRATRLRLGSLRELQLHPRIHRPSPVVESVAIRQLGRYLPVCRTRGFPRTQKGEVNAI
jgi:hypothetical protein